MNEEGLCPDCGGALEHFAGPPRRPDSEALSDSEYWHDTSWRRGLRCLECPWGRAYEKLASQGMVSVEREGAWRFDAAAGAWTRMDRRQARGLLVQVNDLIGSIRISERGHEGVREASRLATSFDKIVMITTTNGIATVRTAEYTADVWCRDVGPIAGKEWKDQRERFAKFWDGCITAWLGLKEIE